MISFPHAISLLNQQELLKPLSLELVKQAPLYVHHYGDNDIKMPSRADWEKYSTVPEFQKILPAPITKTVQTANALRGYRIYSILLSDGDQLVAHKMLANDTSLFLMIQAHPVADTLLKLKQEGQPLNLSCKCFTVFPVKNEVSESDPALQNLARTLCVSTMHFIYSIHMDRQSYSSV